MAESFSRIVEKQEKDGGQTISVLGNGAKIDWCFPPIVRCERALDEMAKLYVNGGQVCWSEEASKGQGQSVPCA